MEDAKNKKEIATKQRAKKEVKGKPVKTKTPKTTKPNTVKKQKVKVAKVKKVKKAKPAKQSKVKVKKAKKAKKTKTLKQKIFRVAISSILILSLLLGIGYIFTLNDFAMTTILSNNVEKSLAVVDDAILANFNSRYLDFKFEASTINSYTGEVSQSSLAYLKVIKHDDESFSYTGNFHLENTPDLLVNYKNGKFFWHYQELNYNQQATQDVRASLMPIAPYFNQNHILPMEATTVANFTSFNSIKASFVLRTKPFYFGERFVMSYNGLPEEKEIYELDHLGNLRKRIYMRNEGAVIYKSEITYLTVNKIFELYFHPFFVI